MQTSTSDGSERDRRVGRFAHSPLSIPWAGWLDVVARVVDGIRAHRALLVAASVAYYATLALFPAMVATFSLYALWADPSTLARQLAQLSIALPDSARSLIESEVSAISASTAGLSVGVAASIGFSFFAASSGVVALIEGVNLAYDEEETRGFLVLRWLALRFAVGLSLFVCIAVTSLTVLPALSNDMGLGLHVPRVAAALRWPVLALSVLVGLALLYRYAPNRTPPKFRWVLPGVVLATVIWLGASLGLSAYVEHFGNYNRTYGTVGAVIVLLLWFYVSGFAIVLGAELNAELEHQTAVDTTVGPEAPLGQRHAVKADTLGKSTPPRPFGQLVWAAFRALTAPRRGKTSPTRATPLSVASLPARACSSRQAACTTPAAPNGRESRTAHRASRCQRTA
jgi:membrane protein